jgi:hypothetical protein
MKRLLSSVFIILSIAVFAFGDSIATGGKKVDISKDLARFNSDVAAWNKQCITPKNAAEDAWCKKERVRIDAKRAELVAAGAITK